MTPKFLGFSDEPQGIGAVVAVNYGDYRTRNFGYPAVRTSATGIHLAGNSGLYGIGSKCQLE